MTSPWWEAYQADLVRKGKCGALKLNGHDGAYLCQGHAHAGLHWDGVPY